MFYKTLLSPEDPVPAAAGHTSLPRHRHAMQCDTSKSTKVDIGLAIRAQCAAQRRARVAESVQKQRGALRRRPDSTTTHGHHCCLRAAFSSFSGRHCGHRCRSCRARPTARTHQLGQHTSRGCSYAPRHSLVSRLWPPLACAIVFGASRGSRIILVIGVVSFSHGVIFYLGLPPPHPTP